MALGVPRLDQLITQLDSISGKFDSDDDLNKLEFTKPNLEQLDNYASNLDALATFGNLEAFDGFFVRQGTVSVTVTGTVSATAGLLEAVASSVSVSASISSGSIRIRPVASSVATSIPFSESMTVFTAKTAIISIQLSIRVLSALPG